MPSYPLPVHRAPILLGRDFNTSPEPLREWSGSASQPHVLVIGAGVSGCTTAWLLLDRGYRVTVLAKDFPSFTPDGAHRITSQVGAALWEFPSPPCGPRLEPENMGRVRQWAVESYLVYQALAGASETAMTKQGAEDFGVRMRRSISLYPFRADAYAPESERLQAMHEAGPWIRGFRRDAGGDLVDELARLQADGPEARNWDSHRIVDASECVAPVIDTDRAMLCLVRLLRSKGAAFVRHTISGSLAGQEDELRARFQADAIVNASGLGARELADDEALVGARGAMLRVLNDGRAFAKLDAALVINNIWREDHDVVYLVPRNDKILVVGNFLEEEAREKDHSKAISKTDKKESSTKDKYDFEKVSKGWAGVKDNKLWNEGKKDDAFKKSKTDDKLKVKVDMELGPDSKVKEKKLDKEFAYAAGKKSDKEKRLEKPEKKLEEKLGEKLEEKPKKLGKNLAHLPGKQGDKKRETKTLAYLSGEKGDKKVKVKTGSAHDDQAAALSLSSTRVQALFDRARRVMPGLAGAQLDPEYPLAQAWRPVRQGDVRVEREGLGAAGPGKVAAAGLGKVGSGSRIVHAYGHGVYGWSVAFGSAAEAAWLVDGILSEASAEYAQEKESAGYNPSVSLTARAKL